jgi:hypothetical protein
MKFIRLQVALRITVAGWWKENRQKMVVRVGTATKCAYFI